MTTEQMNLILAVATAAMAIGTFILAGVTVHSTKVSRSESMAQRKDYHFSLQVQLLLNLDERFNSRDFRLLRQGARRTLEVSPSDSDDILDFFETIGYLCQNGALDNVMVWHSFYFWIMGYWETRKSHIEAKRKEDKCTWQDLAWLRQEVERIQELKSPGTPWTKEYTIDFLDGELTCQGPFLEGPPIN